MRLSHVNPRSMLAFAHDIVAAGIAWLIAFWLRFNFDISPEFAATMWKTVGAVVVLDATCFLGFGLYRGMWRYASLHDFRLILIAVAVGGNCRFHVRVDKGSAHAGILGGPCGENPNELHGAERTWQESGCGRP